MLRLAIRNIWRNKVRTMITGSAVAGGLALLMVGHNINHGSYMAMLETGVSTASGHVVVQGAGWQDEPNPVDFRVVDSQEVAEELRAAFPEGKVLRRSMGAGLLSSPKNSVGVLVSAIEPALEAEVSDWHEKLVEGEWLAEGDTRGIVLGAELARTLGIGLGKKVVLMGQGKEDVSSRLFRVRGTFRTGAAQADGFMAFTTVASFQEFLGEPGAASQISLHLKDPEATDAALVRVKERLGDREGLEILPWKEALAELYQFTVLDRSMNFKFMFFIGMIVALGILNTVLMSVMERIREFGVMLALGMSPRKLRQLILLEGLVLGVVAATIGLALGSALTHYLVKHGIDYSEMIGETMEISGVAISSHIYAAWDPQVMLGFTLIAVFFSVAATFYPAWKAGKLQPVESMRHV